MLGRHLIGIAAAVWVLAGAPVFAAGDAASLEHEYADLHRQLLEKPDDLELMGRFAHLASRLGNYDAAIMTFERMLLMNPDLPAVRIEIGVLYYRLEAYQTAKIYLDDIVADPGATAEQHARAMRYLDEIDSRLSRHQFSGSAMAGVRYQSNANSGPGTSAVGFGGFPGILNPAFVERDDFNVFGQLSLAHDYNFVSPYDESWRTTLLGYIAKQFSVDEADLGYGELNSGPRFAVAPNSLNGLFVRPYVATNVAFATYDLHNYGIGGGVELIKEYGDDAEIGLRYRMLYRDYLNSAERPANSLQDTIEHQGTFYVAARLIDTLTAYGAFVYLRDDADFGFHAHDRFEGQVRLSYVYDDPFGLTNWPWQVSVGGRYIVRDYDAPDPLIAPGIVREDHEYRIFVSNNFQFWRDWSLYVLFEYTRADSNVVNYDYDNYSALGAIRRRF